MLVLEGLKQLEESLGYIILAIQETRSVEGQGESERHNVQPVFRDQEPWGGEAGDCSFREGG